MLVRSTIQRPNYFVVQPYEPGLLIDCSEEVRDTDVDRLRDALKNVTSSAQDSGIAAIDDLLHAMEICPPGEFQSALRRFSGETDLVRAAEVTCYKIGVSSAGSLSSMCIKILEETGITKKPPHFPTQLYCHIPGQTTVVPTGETAYGFVMNESETYAHLADGRKLQLFPQTYFCLPGPFELVSNGQVELIIRRGYLGLQHIGGLIEPWGRLKYIDGCTDTMLIAPARRGDPCYNVLYFPPGTTQTSHVHPSLRAGLVIGGEGVCKTPSGDHALVPGNLFFLPPETSHSFHTANAAGFSQGRAALTVLAFHPDSDCGPTDTDHAMLNRTYFDFIHRLESVQRFQQAA
jgi:hypothetical protein